MTILDDIFEMKKIEVQKLKKDYSLSRFKDSMFFETENKSFFDALNHEHKISIIAEIKKASPSKGIIKEKFNYLDIASIYMENGVDAISILTDEKFFQGSIKYLHDVARIKNVPLLRKDFIIDEFQIYEAKSNGADAVLLITELLSRSQIAELTHASYENGLEVLLELHSQSELKKIDFNLNRIIGINNRNLKNFNVDLKSTGSISDLIPKTNLLVSESGIKNRKDIDYLKNTKTKAILVGEHFMASSEIGESVKLMKEWCSSES